MRMPSRYKIIKLYNVHILVNDYFHTYSVTQCLYLAKYDLESFFQREIFLCENQSENGDVVRWLIYDNDEQDNRKLEAEIVVTNKVTPYV